MTRITTVLGVLAVSAITARVVSAQTDVKSLLCPQPKNVSVDPGGAPADLSRGARIVFLADAHEWAANAAERLRFEIDKLPKPAVSAGPMVAITIGVPADWRKAGKHGVFAEPALAAVAAEPESYALRAGGGEVSVCACDLRGAVNALETLIQLLRAGPKLPALAIDDRPDTTLRVSYVGGGGELDDRTKRIIDRAIRYKLNTLVFENSAYYHLDDESTLARVKAVFDYCRARGIEPVPELQSFGWSQYVLPIDPMCVEAVRWSKRVFRFGEDSVAVPFQEGAGTPLPLRNGGLDEARGNAFTGWEQDVVGREIFADPDGKGGKCARITCTTSQQRRLWQKVPCAPDAFYLVEADVKTEARGADFSAYFEVYGGDALLAALPHIARTGDWKRYRLRVKNGANTELTIYLRIQQGTGTAWFDNVSCTVAPPTPMVNVIATPDAPIEVTSLDGTVVFAEGVDYDVIPGELRFEGGDSAPFPLTNKPWQIRRRQSGKIAGGARVLVSYDWAEPGDITYCPSEPRTHALMEKAITETIRALKPRWIHLGHDEPRVINRDSRCRKRNLKAYEIFLEDVIRMREYVRNADPACRMMIWADTLRTTPDGNVQIAWHTKETCRLQDITRKLPKDIVLCVWEYEGREYQPIHDSMAVLIREGFDVTGSPWYGFVNAYRWAQAARALRKHGERCQGIFLTTWDDRWDALPLSADLMWNLPEPGEHDAAELERKLKTVYSGL